MRHSAGPERTNVGDSAPRRLRSNSELTMTGQKTPSAPAAVATPNMTPAIVPDRLPVGQQQDVVKPLSPSQGSSAANLSRGSLPLAPAAFANSQPVSTPRGGALNLTVTPGTAAHAKPVGSIDYFSSRTPKSDTEDSDAGDQTPGASTLHSGLRAPDATPSPGTPTQGGGLIGRLKSLRKGPTPPKRPVTSEDIASPVPVTEETEVVEESVTVSYIFSN